MHLAFRFSIQHPRVSLPVPGTCKGKMIEANSNRDPIVECIPKLEHRMDDCCLLLYHSVNRSGHGSLRDLLRRHHRRHVRHQHCLRRLGRRAWWQLIQRLQPGLQRLRLLGAPPLPHDNRQRAQERTAEADTDHAQRAHSSSGCWRMRQVLLHLRGRWRLHSAGQHAKYSNSIRHCLVVLMKEIVYTRYMYCSL